MEKEKQDLEEKQEQDQKRKKEQASEALADMITDVTDPEKEKERELEQKRAELRAKKRKLIPPFVMLAAGAVVSITMFVLHYKTKDMLIILLCVLIAFSIAGELLKWMLDRFEAQVEEARMDEGEVIEKEQDAQAGEPVRAAAQGGAEK